MLAFTLCTFTMAKDAWRTGTVVSVSGRTENRGTYRGPLGNAQIAVPIYVTQVDMDISDGQSVYHCYEMRHGRQRLPVLARGAHISIRVEKGNLIFLDQVGTKHKATITSIGSQ